VGQRVACGGAGYANHAEVNFVPKNLVVPVPDSVLMKHAAYATVGAIAMQGFRQAELQLGETVCVVGLGLLGQILVQILRAAGDE
jgi:D-arabinose 1-dehydrogenase-like Zn-dependent alcohol dehydrogenase